MVATDTARCRSCGADVPPQSRFCNSCGAALEAPAAREERKLVSVLFVDLVGFTARSDRADPEDVRELLQLYHAHAKRCVEHYGGVLEKFIGDAVMAVFGAPTAHGDDAERAVRAGLRVLASIDEMNREHGLGLAARAAVNTGEAVVTLDGGQTDALATGDVVNTASRLQTAAPAGRLLVGAETYRATRGAIRYEPHDRVDAKGKSEALAAWLAVDAVEDGADAARRPRAPMLGRNRELELMQTVWDRCADEARPHLVTVIGPPGIGKSRLCREFAAQVEARGARFLRGRCLPYEEQVGYQAFSRLARAAARILDSDEPALARDKLGRLVARVMSEAEAAETAQYLALLVGLSVDGDGGRERPEAEQVWNAQLLFYAARRLVEQLGHEQPTVLLFEDVHWAQPSEVALLEYLAAHVRETPVLLLATARPELRDTHPSWGAGLTSQTTIPLEPLRAEDAEALAARLGADRTPGDLARLVETAGGNPLFLEELVSSVAEAGAGDDLPVTVREAIAARIDALRPDARAALLAAAVVGRAFWRGVVAATGDVQDVDGTLAALEARDFVRREPVSRIAGDVEFTFKHMLIREVAYATLPRAARRARHAAVAAHLEQSVAGASQEHSTILAHHWREAGEPARAIPYLLAAAEAARRSWAQSAVVDLYTMALDLTEDEHEKRRVRLQRAVALVQLDDYERAVEELAPLVDELAGRDRLDALLALHHAYVWTERDAEALETARAAASLADEIGDEAARAAAIAAESQALAMRGADGDLDRAFELGERALRLWVPGARALDRTHHLHLHTDTLYWTGRYDRALELARETRALAADVHIAESLLRGGGTEALTLTGLGRHEEAIAIWDELFVIAQELGQNPRGLLNYSALAYRELYDLEEARRRSEEALELSASMAFGMPRQFAGSDLVFTDLLAGDVGAAQAAWPARWAAAEHATAWTTWLIAGRLAAARAEIALHAEPVDSALEWSARALELARRTRRRKYEARSLTLYGLALARAGRKQESLDTRRAAVELADSLVGAPARWSARAALAETAYALGADDAAAAAGAEAAALVRGFAQTLAPDRAAAFLARPQIEPILAHT
ncbi:MAG TPA: adenylate/guanylate cyclase domain-containing protein [Gaiellaceae bacterium]|nr:adenylate/guanylate cyclase domain-containing protein [Gaiellaceae bacterium]